MMRKNNFVGGFHTHTKNVYMTTCNADMKSRARARMWNQIIFINKRKGQRKKRKCEK